eukprot:55554_1
MNVHVPNVLFKQLKKFVKNGLITQPIGQIIESKLNQSPQSFKYLQQIHQLFSQKPRTNQILKEQNTIEQLKSPLTMLGLQHLGEEMQAQQTDRTTAKKAAKTIVEIWQIMYVVSLLSSSSFHTDTNHTHTNPCTNIILLNNSSLYTHDNEWQCSMCTLLNESFMNKCKVCGTKRFGDPTDNANTEALNSQANLITLFNTNNNHKFKGTTQTIGLIPSPLNKDNNNHKFQGTSSSLSSSSSSSLLSSFNTNNNQKFKGTTQTSNFNFNNNYS